MNKLRKTLGILGILLPILTIVFSIFGFKYFGVPIFIENISSSHYFNSYLFFEGILLSVGLFLIHYDGYDIGDKTLTTIAGIGAIITCFFPYQPLNALITNPWNFIMLDPSITMYFHMVGALTFFVCLFIMECFRFTKTSGELTKEKIIRNKIYTVCGWITLLGILVCVPIDNIPQVFHLKRIYLGPFGFGMIGEMVSLWAFGIAWLIKGEFLIKDKTDQTFIGRIG
jgi:hypothetical protein